MLVKGDIAKGLKINGRSLSPCEGCALGKSQCLPLPKEAETKQTHPLELVYANLVGSISLVTPGRAKYGLKLLDGCTRMQWHIGLPNKDDAKAAFSKWQDKVELESKEKLGVLRTDNSGEFTGAAFTKALHLGKVQVQLSAPYIYAHHQIGPVECAHQTVFNQTQVVLKDNGLPNIFWGEITAPVVYLKN
jgi:hypothetical protein